MTVAEELSHGVLDHQGLAPAAAMAALARSGIFGDHVVYERPGQWVLAGAAEGSVELDAGELRVSWQGQLRRQRWTGSPAQALQTALASVPAAERSVSGWIAFEFCAHAFGAGRYVAPGTALARLLIPRIEVTADAAGLRVAGASQPELAQMQAVLAKPARVLHPIQMAVRSGAARYQDRVAAAIAEIQQGKYQKVILSRQVEVPQRLDIPGTYQLGRAANTPARSFLLRLDGLEAAGFSPELVLSVSPDGLVTTEPLAGTRALGRGAAADAAARQDLVGDPKEIVEHAMSVRTSFAEIAGITEPGSAAIADFMAVRERGSVQHLASTVRGQLWSPHGAWQAVEALFPAVTASGIPKGAAIDAIFRLDGPARGVYSGAVVTVSAAAGLEAALVLRAVYQRAAGAWLRAGAGVIAQSDPAREFEETCEKLASVAPYLVPAR